jgi:hypothetical protein
LSTAAAAEAIAEINGRAFNLKLRSGCRRPGEVTEASGV